MNGILKTIAACSVISLATATPGFAQVAMFDPASVEAVCAASPTDCDALIQQIIAQLKAAGLDANSFASQLGLLASSVLIAAQNSGSGNAASVLGATLRLIASESSDPDQANAILAVAAIVEAGDADTIVVSGPIGASPA